MWSVENFVEFRDVFKSLSVLESFFECAVFAVIFALAVLTSKIIAFTYSRKFSFSLFPLVPGHATYVTRVMLNVSTPILFLIFGSVASTVLFDSPVRLSALKHALMWDLILKLGLIWCLVSFVSSFSKSQKISHIVTVFTLSMAYFSTIGSGISSYFSSATGVAFYLSQLEVNFGNVHFSVYNMLFFVFGLFGVFWLNGIALRITEGVVMNLVYIDSNLRSIILKFSNVGIFVITLVVVLGISGIDLRTLTMFGSAAVVGISFGLQRIASNFISGIVLSFEKSLEEDDILSVKDSNGGEVYGTVRSLHMRYVLIETFDGKEVMVPNETLTSSNVTNLTYTSNKIRLSIGFIVGMSTDLALLKQEMEFKISENKYRYTLEKSTFEVIGIKAHGVDVMVYFWISDINDFFEGRTSIITDLISVIRGNKVVMATDFTRIQVEHADGRPIGDRELVALTKISKSPVKPVGLEGLKPSHGE